MVAGQHNKGNIMEWREINCIIEGFILLIEKYRKQLEIPNISEDEHSDIANDLAYTEILLHKYEIEREKMAAM